MLLCPAPARAYRAPSLISSPIPAIDPCPPFRAWRSRPTTRRTITVRASSSHPNPSNSGPGLATSALLPGGLRSTLGTALRGAAYLVAGGVLLLAAAIPAAPYVLSTPTGLQACLGVVNRVIAPADVAVAIEAVEAGWTSPLVIHNLTITRSKGKKRKGGGTQTRNQQLHGQEPPRPAAGSDYTKEGDMADPPLLAVETIRTSTSLWQAAIVRKPTDVIVHRPYVWGIPDPDGGFALDKAATALGLSAAPHTLHTDIAHLPPPDNSATTGSSSTSTTGASSSDTKAAPSIGAPGRSTAATTVPPPKVEGVTVPWTGELRTAHIHVSLVQGTATIAEELRDIVGGNIHVQILEGAAAIVDEAEEGEDVEWTQQPPSVALPSFAGHLKDPVLLRLDSSNLSARMSGWGTSASYRYLPTPATATLRLADPKTMGAVMARLNPLLNDIVAVASDGNIEGRVMPAAGLWPAAEMEVGVGGMRIGIGQGTVVRRALTVLSLADSGFKSLPQRVTVALSPLHVTISKSGHISAQRLDWSVEVPGKSTALHLVSWGEGSTNKEGGIAMTLCLPSDTLRLVGITTVEEGLGVAFEVTGTVEAPQLNISKASKTIATLLMQQQAARVQASGALPAWMSSELSQAVGGGSAGLVRVPPPVAAVAPPAAHAGE